MFNTEIEIMKETESFLHDPDILNVYKFGSQVYGTARPDSDTDLIIITNKPFINQNSDHQYYTKEEFQRFINNEDINKI